MDEVPVIIEKAPFLHRDISGDLLHTGLIRMRCHPCDFTPCGFQDE